MVPLLTTQHSSIHYMHGFLIFSCSFFFFFPFSHLTNICLWFQVALVAINVLGDSVDGRAFNTIVSERSPSPATHHWTYICTAMWGAVVLWFCETLLCHWSLCIGLTDASSSIHCADAMTVWTKIGNRSFKKTSQSAPHISYIIYTFSYICIICSYEDGQIMYYGLS